MPPQARIGDASQVPADAHGCPGCPHTALGPAISGSSNVRTNGLPSVRVGDSGIHAACCGPNVWNAKTGSRSVLINGRPAHRLNDLVTHCGGMGRTIEGSSNVLVGDNCGGGAVLQKEDKSAKERVVFRLLDDLTLNPLANISVKLTYPDGSLHQHQTDSNGEVRIEAPEDGSYELMDVTDYITTKTHKY